MGGLHADVLLATRHEISVSFWEGTPLCQDVEECFRWISFLPTKCRCQMLS